MNDDYLKKAKDEIERWEKEGPGWLSRIGSFILWPAQKAAELLIPDAVQEAVGKAIEGFLLGISTFSQSIVGTETIKTDVAKRCSAFGEHPELWEQLTAADEEAQSRWNWHLGYAATEGGATGVFGLPGLAADIPALFTVVIRMIQQIAICYGYDPTKPEEQEYVMHILRTGSASDVAAKMEALIFLKQVEQILIKVAWKKMAADLAAKQIGAQSMLAALRQFAKSLGINLTKRKALQMVPIIGALVGASFNATYTNDIGHAAYFCYRRRWIADREHLEGEI